MMRRVSISGLVICSATIALAYGCSTPAGDDSQTGGTGGSGHIGSGGTPSTGGSGGNPSLGGSGGTTSSGGSGGSGGSGAAGGMTGAGGTVSTGGRIGSGGMGVAGAPTGGRAAMMGSGGAGPAGMGGSSGTATGGKSGRGMGGAGTGVGGSAGMSMAGTGPAGAAGMVGGAGTSGGGTGMSAGCGTTPTIASGMYNNGQHISITVGSMQRRYILNVPTTYDKTKPYKLIIAYHELNGNDDEMYKNKYYHLLPLSGDSTIFVAPNGQQNGASCTQASGCGWPNTNNTDLALADAVVAEIEKNFCVDTNRIFATGWSYGGSMSYKTACERPLGGVTNGFVRAIAVYSGSQLSGNCTPKSPVAYYASHGTHDSVLNYDNGVGLAQNFSTANSCTWMTPTKVTSGAHVCTNLMGCKAGYPLEFCSFNGDHTPDPDNGSSGNSWEYQNVWDFFKQF